MEKLPWSHLDSQEISRMWQKESCNNPRMLPLGPAIPLHVGSFLQLGLQPELSERYVDLKEISLMIRLQAAVSRSQQKEENKKSSPPPVRVTSSATVPKTFTNSQIEPQHGWDAVKESFKKRRTPPPPLPPLPPPPPGQGTLEVSNDSMDDSDAEIDQSVP